jgi:hypothetical protein
VETITTMHIIVVLPFDQRDRGGVEVKAPLIRGMLEDRAFYYSIQRARWRFADCGGGERKMAEKAHAAWKGRERPRRGGQSPDGPRSTI